MSTSDQKPENLSIEMGGKTLFPGDYIGSYRYIRSVGKGGMADVLLASDPSNSLFALKVLKASRFQSGRARFGREFRALTRLRHPNVIRVDSFGDIFGHPYIAMEYVEGTDLHNVIRNFRDLSLNQRWQRSKTILTELCHALSYIHSRGFVHRDLKPSNVLITQEGSCKVTDFGIVKDLDPSLEDKSTTLVGTWAYTSPEQIGGLEIDHRSDLYSLGIILYAMLTSRRPFAAQNMAGYLKLHRDKKPKSPSQFIPEVPSLLESICLKLLQKSPQDRFQSAQEILVLLGQAQPDPALQKQLHAWELPFNSNRNDRTVIQQAIGQLNHSSGQLLIISGPTGYGKSSLLKFATRLAQQQQLPVHFFSLHANQNPLENLVSISEQIRKESADEELTKILYTLSQSGLNPQSDTWQRLTAALQSALKKLLEERPQIILIDGLNHAAESIFDLIELWKSVLIEQLKLPLLICTTIEGEVSNLQIAPPWSSLKLEPLTQAQIEALLKDTFKVETDLSALSSRLHSETDGVPLFLTEYIRYLITLKHITVDQNQLTLKTSPDTIADLQLEVPPSIRQLARSQYSTLSQPQKAVINLMASLARESDLDFLLDLLCEDTEEEEQYLDAIHQLDKAGVLLSRQIGISQYIRFERTKVSEVIYEDLSNSHRIEIHIKIAQILEQQYSHHKTLNLCQQIGEHYRRAEKMARAYKYLSVASMELLERGLIAEALKLSVDVHPMMRAAKEGLSHEDFIQSRCNLLQVQSGVTRNRGEWKENAKALRTLLRYARELESWSLEMTSSLYLGQAFINLGQINEGESRLLKTLEACKLKHDRNLINAALHHLCQLEWSRGNIQQCEVYATEALMRTSRSEQTISRANSLLSLSAVQAAQGHILEARVGMEEAAVILEHLNRSEKQTTVLCNLAEVYIWQGEWLAGVKLAQKAFQLSERTLHKTGQLHATITMALAYYAMGQRDALLVHAQRSLHLSRQLNIPTHIVVSNALLAIYHLTTDPISALVYSQNALEQSKHSDPEQYKAILIILEEICKHEAGEPLQNVIDDKFEMTLQHLPVPRRIEGWLFLAQYWIRIGQSEKSTELAKKANEMATRRKMLTHALRARRILSTLDETSVSIQAHEQFTDLRSSLIEPLSEREKVNAMHFYSSGFSL